MKRNQVAQDHQLLETARDYYQFVTNFFEVINVSATHIYHSALELSPLSSTVRKLYYSQQPHPSPRVVIGVPDSWDSSTVASPKHSRYLSSTWSPCGQLVATVTEEGVEIWDAHALKPLSTLHSAKLKTRLRGGLGYSPDGHSLAGCSDTAIMIWDTQTGGEITKIPCEVPRDGLELAWSLDGRTVGAVLPQGGGTFTVQIFDIGTGISLFATTLQSQQKPHLWPHGSFFQITTIAGGHQGCRVNIFEVGSTLTRTKSFPLKFSHWNIGAFSPETYQVSVS